MQHLARWHVWLGWLAALPLLLWLISGLFMTLRPIEQVRGEHLRATAKPVDTAGLVAPDDAGLVSKLALADQLGRPIWIATRPDKAVLRFSARDGAVLGPVVEAEARQLARAAFAGEVALVTVQRFSADQAPLDLRKARPSWQAAFADGTHVYIDADSGEVLALRSSYWRLYDFMWGLHIMDPAERENSSHAMLWIAGALVLAVSLFGAVLLFRRRQNRL